MSSKLNSDVRYAYMRGGALAQPGKRLRVKADMSLFMEGRCGRTV